MIEEAEMDWREVRARLVAKEQQLEAPASDGSYIYESPLIEQGSILLGGTEQSFGFALRQQFFHKSVMLLLQHDDRFTKGIILNRPSALELDGWRLWCGHGQVGEGGIFLGADAAMGELEINCLHSLEGELAKELSTTVIKGVSYTSLEGAKELVAAGVAKREDFWVCVGYSGWAPGQLQMEYETRSSWYLASAGSGTLLSELLLQAQSLPPPGEGTDSVDLGIDTWGSLMRSIGKEQAVNASLGSLEDRMLREWVRAHLLAKAPRKTPAAPPPIITAGSVFCSSVSADTGRPADRVLLREQFLHKAVLLCIGDYALEPDGKLVLCVLNRPTDTVMQLNVPGSPRRRVAFTGSTQLAGNGQLWLHHRHERGGVAVGDSGVYALAASDVAEQLRSGDAIASDFLLVSGSVEMTRAELAGMLSAGEMRSVRPGEALSKLWTRAWSLLEDEGDVSDGSEVWWLASLCGKADASDADDSEALAVPAPSELADEALGEWIEFFARRNKESGSNS